VNEPFRARLVGRFKLDVPAAFGALPQDSSVAGVSVSEIQLPGGFEAQWSARLNEIREQKEGGRTIRIVETKSPSRDVRIVQYNEESTIADSIAIQWLEALIDGGRVGWVAKLKWYEDRSPPPHRYLSPEEEAAVVTKKLTCFYDVIAARQLLPPDVPRAVNRGWFYLPNMAIALPIRRPTGMPADDFVAASFEDRGRDMFLHVTGQVQDLPESKDGAPGFVAGIVEAIARLQMNVKILRTATRTVGQIDGEEVLLIDRDRNKLDYTWRFRRQKDRSRGYLPYPEIEMSGRPADEPEVTAIWDHLLESFVTLPVP
jgi:hypothetical protein